jgi:hypothetical protein
VKFKSNNNKETNKQYDTLVAAENKLHLAPLWCIVGVRNQSASLCYVQAE